MYLLLTVTIVTKIIIQFTNISEKIQTKKINSGKHSIVTCLKGLSTYKWKSRGENPQTGTYREKLTKTYLKGMPIETRVSLLDLPCTLRNLKLTCLIQRRYLVCNTEKQNWVDNLIVSCSLDAF